MRPFRPGTLIESRRPMMDVNDDIVPARERFRVTEILDESPMEPSIKIRRLGGTADMPQFVWHPASDFDLVTRLWVSPSDQ